MKSRPESDLHKQPSPASALDRRHVALVLLAIAGIKLMILAVDPSPRFFLWDSVTYLHGAIDGALPRDRSFLYSLAIGAIAVPLHSLNALVVAQTLAGVASAFFAFLIVMVNARRE